MALSAIVAVVYHGYGRGCRAAWDGDLDAATPMREYYTRLMREVGRSMRLFWKAQVLAGLVAGVISAIVSSFDDGSNYRIVSAAIAVIMGYLGVIGLFFIGSLMYAPVKIDQQRAQEIAASAVRISDLEATLIAKHPHDERKEIELSRFLKTRSAKECDAIRWLLDAGEVSRGKLQALGLDADSLYNNPNSPPLLCYRSIRHGNQLHEFDRAYYVNPNMVTALKNVLYPPPSGSAELGQH